MFRSQQAREEVDPLGCVNLMQSLRLSATSMVTNLGRCESS